MEQELKIGDKLTATLAKQLRVGDVVSVTKGPFNGQTWTVADLSEDRVGWHCSEPPDVSYYTSEESCWPWLTLTERGPDYDKSRDTRTADPVLDSPVQPPGTVEPDARLQAILELTRCVRQLTETLHHLL